MKLWLLANDPRLAEMLEKSGDFAAVLAVTAQTAGYEDGDAMVVSDAIMDIQAMMELRSRHERAKLVYLLSNRSDSRELMRVQSLCAAHRIDFVPPLLAAEQVAREVSAACLGRTADTSRVIAGVAALPQTGLTSSLLLLGVRLGALTGIRVGILGLNGWNPGDSGIPYNGKYFDEIWGSLQGKQLRPDDLLRHMQRISPEVHYLAGNRDLKKLYYYQTEGVSWLISAAKQQFDMVLIDAGAYLDHALAAQSIYESDLLLVQLNQSRQAGEQWSRVREQILRPVFHYAEDKSMLVFNKMLAGPELENARQLAKQWGLPYMASLPYVPDFYRSEAEQKLLELADEGYTAEIGKACRALMQFYGLPRREPSSKSMERRKEAAWLRLPRWLRAEGGTAFK
ncbi:hypothetical protein [Paenibacillus hamazuiensis]|uniref:hypothetical protein n=1 Tax=Paenibacillus hamazuiensis TaxID=2936508 RepID=UPI00200D16E1|nr:hypothetical protein [Paenibacillus hamazuiensis]